MRVAKRTSPAPRGEGVVTSLVAKRGRTDRIAVYLEGSRAFDLAAMVVEKAGLRVGDALSEDAQNRLLRLDAPFRARERALALLALSDRSRREMELRLKTGGFDAEAISGTVAWLEGLDYLNDRRFVARYAAEKLKSGWGPHRIRAELLRKGVERRLVEEGLAPEAGGGSGPDGMETVTALVRRRFGRQFRDDPVTAGRKLAGFLARRGYDWDAIAVVTRTLKLEAVEGEAAKEAEPGAARRPELEDGLDAGRADAGRAEAHADAWGADRDAHADDDAG